MATGPGEEGTNVADSIVTKFATYEQYLDCQITPTDLYYLEARERTCCRVTTEDFFACRTKSWPDSWWSWATEGVER